MLGEYEYRNGAANRRSPVAVEQYPVAVDTAGRYKFDPYYQTVEGVTVDLSRYWRMLMKHRWVILACVVGALTVGLAATLLMTRIYHAEATLKIDLEADRVVNVENVQPREESGANEEFYQTQYGLLKARTLASNVVDRLGLATNNHFFKAMGVNPPPPGASLATRQRATVKMIQLHTTVTPVRGSRLVKVGFDSPDPELAASIANTTVKAFIASNLDRRYESSGYAREFLENKLAETKQKLEAADRAVADYATREGIINVSPTSGASNAGPTGTQSIQVSSLIALNSALESARGDRIKAEERWRQAQAGAVENLPDVLQNPTIQELNQAKAKLQAEYEEKSKTYKPDYPDLVAMRSRLAELDKQTSKVMDEIRASLKVNYDVALNQEKSFEAQVKSAQSATLDMGERSIQYGILQREADTYRSLYDTLLQRYKEVGIVGSINTNNISIVDEAEKPAAPSRPQPVLNMALSLVMGLALGVILAFCLEIMDESIATPEDLESKLGLPVLGSVPKLSKSQTPVEALADPRSPFSEAYYSIRTALQFSTGQGAPSSLLITSSRPSEGKSTTAVAIAKNFARVGISVLLVDGDMRNPSLHRSLGVENLAGLSNLLTRATRIVDVAVATDTPNLSFIPCGPLPPNPAELLAGDGFHLFLEEAQKTYQMVVIDGPPVLGLADAPALAAAISGTVFVVESRGTRRGLANTAVRRLQMGNARVLGAVLTKFDAKQSAYGYGAGYAYAYDYSYGPKQARIQA